MLSAFIEGVSFRGSVTKAAQTTKAEKVDEGSNLADPPEYRGGRPAAKPKIKTPIAVKPRRAPTFFEFSRAEPLGR
jgi:hypothetical protein